MGRHKINFKRFYETHKKDIGFEESLIGGLRVKIQLIPAGDIEYTTLYINNVSEYVSCRPLSRSSDITAEDYLRN